MLSNERSMQEGIRRSRAFSGVWQQDTMPGIQETNLVQMGLERQARAERIHQTWKARLVILGCFQRQYLDYNSTFAPNARSSTIPILLSVAGTYDLELRNYDIVSALLGSKLQEDFWVTLPAGVRGFQKGQVVKLLASV